MEIVRATDISRRDPSTNRLFPSIFLSFLLYPIALAILINILLSFHSRVMYIYEELGVELPGITVMTSRLMPHLAQYGFLLVVLMGPILACKHVALRDDAVRQRRFVRGFAACLILTAIGLFFALGFPLTRR